MSAFAERNESASSLRPANKSPNVKVDAAIQQFETGFFLFDSVAEENITSLAQSDRDDSVMERPLLQIYASFVILWRRRQEAFDEASQIYQFIADTKKPHGTLTKKENGLAEALRLSLLRDFSGVVAEYGRYLKDFPFDTVALRMLILCNFFVGHSKEIFLIFDSESVKANNWGCPTFKSYYCMYGSFAGVIKPSMIESIWKEMGCAESGSGLTQSWTVQHAGAHVLVSRPLGELIKYMEDATLTWGVQVGPGYRSHGFFHLALLYAFNGNVAKAKSFFYSEIWREGPSRSGLLIQMNAIGFLWILQLAEPGSVSVSEWEDVAKHVIDSKLYSDDLCIMPLIAAAYCLHQSGKSLMALECEKLMSQRKGSVEGNKAGLALLKGCLLFCRGNYKQAAELMEPFASEEGSEAIGSSDEQRLPLWYTYIASLAMSSDTTDDHVRIRMMEQVSRHERAIWPIESLLCSKSESRI